MNKNEVIVITGPTASGKSNIAYELAIKINGEIISSDSMQVYKYLDIGTAKPSKEYLETVKHHLIDIVLPTEEFNVVMFKKLASEAIEDVLKRNKVPIVVGGTGLYLNSLIFNLDFSKNQGNEEKRKEYEEIVKTKGKDELYNLLKELDQESANRIHPNNVKRVIRAIEIAQEEKKHKYISTFSTYLKPLFNFKVYVINMNRAILYDRINKRVDEMFEEGLLEETQNLINKNLLTSKTASQAIGYKEVKSYLNNKISLNEAIELIKKNSRNYAKRQITWFKKIKDITWIENINDIKINI